MSDEVVLYGASGASYSWTAALICIEKGVPYRFESIKLKSDGYRDEHHPYMVMPAMQHGEVKLFESSAIARYIDGAFEGPALQPSDPLAIARMEQWISMFKAYVYKDAVPRYFLQYLFPKGADGQPDRAAIDAAIPDVTYHLDTFEAGIDGNPYVVGDTLTLADLFIGPILHHLSHTPELGAHLKGCPKLSRVLAALRERQSYKDTAPPPPEFAKAA